MIESREGRTGVPRGPVASWYGHGGWLRVGREGLGYLEDLSPPGTVTGDGRESGGKDWGT